MFYCFCFLSRYARYYYDNGTPKRDLIRAYGIHVFIEITGYGAKFDLGITFLNFGSSIGALLGVSIGVNIGACIYKIIP